MPSLDTKVIVITEDLDDSERRDVAILNGSAEAERLIETLLEAGVAQERIRVFTGAEVEMEVSQRPTVTLAEGNGSKTTARDRSIARSGDGQEIATEDSEGPAKRDLSGMWNLQAGRDREES